MCKNKSHMCKWLTRTLIDREGKQTKTNTGDTPSKTSEIPTPGSAAARGSAAAPAPAALPPASADIYSDPSPEQVSSLSSTSRHHGLGCSGIDELRRRLVVLPPPLLLRRRNRRERLRLRALHLPTPHIQADRPERVHGAVLGHAVHLLAAQLPHLHVVRPPFVSYGVVLVATVNSIGAVFQLAYTAVFIAFTDAKQRLKVSALLAAVFVVFGLIVFVSLALLDHTTRQMFVGYLSVASLIFMFASPLSIINLVIRTKSVEYMPFYLSLSMFLMSASFFGYGVLLRDFFIYIPNGIGTILGIIQLVLYAYFRKGSSEEARLPLLVTHT
ncbi:unnamed protein product [Miscanthus lutarioriparius]|uniref:Bidirectional sugar transporter SWEET n=1 Tax=Miscanthus lutarioriparius TaxID=422564 RepID=A0A811PCP3_9POAL|nr:unnamed protein product [Miscanthus lutarioriparius]